MTEVTKLRVAERTLKNIGKDIGRVALKVSYPLTGATPSRFQNYLHDYFKSFDPPTATYVSGVFQLVSSVPIVAFATLSDSLFYLPLAFYNIFEGVCRTAWSQKESPPYNRKQPYGSLLLKFPLLPIEYFYDKIIQSKVQLEKELFQPSL